jgi:hypothetical protein
MADDKAASSQSVAMRLRRHPFAVGALLLLIALYLSLAWIARVILEHAVSSALSVPVSIGQLSWHPSIGEVTVTQLLLGRVNERISVERLSIDVDLARLPHREIALDLRIGTAHIAGKRGTELSASRISLPAVHVDLAKSSVDLGAIAVDTPVLAVVVTDEGVGLPVLTGGGSSAGSWTVKSAGIELKGGEVRLRRNETSATLLLKGAHWDGIRSGHATPLSVDAKSADGGSIAIKGALGTGPFNVDLDVVFGEVSLAPLTQLVAALPLQLSKGTGGGTLHAKYSRGSLSLSGKVRANDLLTAPPHANRPAEVMAVHAAEVELNMDPGASPWIDVTLLKLSYPYIMVQRGRGNTFPYSIFANSDVPAAPGDGGAQTAAGSGIRIRRIELEGGKMELVDTTFEPDYWMSLTNITLSASEALLPELTIADFEVAGRHDELSPMAISGSLTAKGLQGRAQVSDLLLESLNPFVSAFLGYKATAGRLSLTATVVPSLPLLDTTAKVVLRGIEVEQTGVDIIQSQSGVPFRIALSLIKTPSGEIALQLPFALDTTSKSLSFGSILGQAIRSAVVGALTSPLRLLGSLFGLNNAPHAFAVEPIPFAVGKESLDDSGKQRIAEIARIVQTHQGLVVVAMPQITEADIHEVGADAAVRLAEERNQAVRDALVGTNKGSHLTTEQIMLVDWSASAGAKATGRPGVYIELQAK